jgi:hypothetical protein
MPQVSKQEAEIIRAEHKKICTDEIRNESIKGFGIGLTIGGIIHAALHSGCMRLYRTLCNIYKGNRMQHGGQA